MLTDNTITVKNQQIHYITGGEGVPVVFIHGIPTSSYLWRNVIPIVAKNFHCIALDLIGMGESDKPDIEYTIEDHLAYVEEFIKALGLSKFHLVMHGVGSIIGFTYAMHHPEKIHTLSFIESYLKAPDSEDDVSMVELPGNNIDTTLSIDKIKESSYSQERINYMMMEENHFVEVMFPSLMLKKLSPEVMAVYQKPFLQKEARKVLVRFILELPDINPHSILIKLIAKYSEWLKTSPIPKLMMYGVPGFLNKMDTVSWALTNLEKISAIEIGKEIHYFPETCFEKIGQSLNKWLKEQTN